MPLRSMGTTVGGSGVGGNAFSSATKVSDDSEAKELLKEVINGKFKLNLDDVMNKAGTQGHWALKDTLDGVNVYLSSKD